MDACLATGVGHLDTANYEPRRGQGEYHWQWASHDRFVENGIALLGTGLTQVAMFLPPILPALSCRDAAGHSRLQWRRSRSAFCNQFQSGINIREVTAPAALGTPVIG